MSRTRRSPKGSGGKLKSDAPAHEPNATGQSSNEQTIEVALFLRAGFADDAWRAIQDTLGEGPIIRADDAEDGALPIHQVQDGGRIYLPRLEIAIVRVGQDQFRVLGNMAAENGLLETVRVLEAITSPRSIAEPALAPSSPPEVEPAFLTYMKGYRAAVDRLIREYGESAGIGAPDPVRLMDVSYSPLPYRDDARGTWGLHATGVLNSRYTGRGVRMAALVDGLDMHHPDWSGRNVVARSFVPNEPPPVVGPGGTHYLGTAAGTVRPSVGPRYGCAPDALPFVAKVLGATEIGSRSSLFAAIEWAVANSCRVILAPLGWGGPTVDPMFEPLCLRAAERGALTVAGAGNNARRSRGDFGFVVNPAACPSVMGVSSVDVRLQLPDFAPRGSGRGQVEIDLVAPGVNLRSSVPVPQDYGLFSGSSTAAAYVAGIAALWAEARPDAGRDELWRALVDHARRLPFPASDAGVGLVQAP